MNAQKFTQKSLEAIQEAQNIATDYSHMPIEQQHLLCLAGGRPDRPDV